VLLIGYYKQFLEDVVMEALNHGPLYMEFLHRVLLKIMSKYCVRYNKQVPHPAESIHS
jgi:hypothetical protein